MAPLEDFLAKDRGLTGCTGKLLYSPMESESLKMG